MSELNQQHAPPDPEGFLMGGGVPSASFLKIGASITGVICEPPVVQQQRDMATGNPKTWEDGNPMWQLVVTLQTDLRDPQIEDDDGRRRVYMKNNMKKAVSDAVRKVKEKALAVGGSLTITYTGDGKPTQKGFNAPKNYEAVYVAPAANLLHDERNQDAPPPNAPASGETVGQMTVAQKIVQKMTDGEAAGVPFWVMHAHDGQTFGTKDSALAGEVKKLIGKSVEIAYTPTQRGRLLNKIVEIPPAAPSDAEETPF